MDAQRTAARHVLVINDVAELLALVEELLEGEGYRVSTASLIPKDLAGIKEDRPHLIILDLLFGDEDFGWQFLQRLKLDPDTARIPIVICTAAVRRVQELSSHLEEMGVGVVIKPYDIDALLAEVGRRLLRD